jgi:hypothetical protein
MTELENALVKLSEECNEVAQRCTKALRFGMEEIQAIQELTNAARIRGEMAGLMAAYDKLVRMGVLEYPKTHEIHDASTKKDKYFEYSKKVGTVTV